jgi:hypothetical protein
VLKRALCLPGVMLKARYARRALRSLGVMLTGRCACWTLCLLGGVYLEKQLIKKRRHLRITSSTSEIFGRFNSQCLPRRGYFNAFIHFSKTCISW